MQVVVLLFVSLRTIVCMTSNYYRPCDDSWLILIFVIYLALAMDNWLTLTVFSYRVLRQHEFLGTNFPVFFVTLNKSVSQCYQWHWRITDISLPMYNGQVLGLHFCKLLSGRLLLSLGGAPTLLAPPAYAPANHHSHTFCVTFSRLPHSTDVSQTVLSQPGRAITTRLPRNL